MKFRMFGSRKMTSGFTLVELLIVVCIVALLSAFVLPGFAPSARAEIPVGGDVITGAYYTQSTLTCTNTGSNQTASVVLGSVTLPAQTQRVRQIITAPASVGIWIGYGSGTDTNTSYLSTTNGIAIPPGGAWTNQRPFLVKNPITITTTNSLGGTGNTNSLPVAATFTIKTREETGSY